MIEQFNEQVAKTIRVWKRDGTKRHPFNSKWPLHPELIFRLNGTWKGWSEFFVVEQSDVNMLQDAVEDEAWEQFDDEYKNIKGVCNGTNRK